MQQFRAVVITNAGNTYNGEWDTFTEPSGRLTDKEMMQYAMKAANEMAGGMASRNGVITVYTSEGWRAFPALSIENLLIETRTTS